MTIFSARERNRSSEPEVSVVIPCLDEASAIARCVSSAREAMTAAGLRGEVVVADNGSADGSPILAEEAGALVVHEARRGYGSALRAGFAAARGRYVVMADADLTYDFADVPRFVERLRDGAEMVIGDRMGSIEKGAMPWLHRYVGNPVLTSVLNLFFGTRVRDAHCGMRGFQRDVLDRLDLHTTGMELASEMVIRAGQEGLRIDQIPIHYSRREGESKLETLSDGWRHLRFLLVHSPTYLFVVPALAMTALGALAWIAVLAGLPLLGRTWQVHALVFSSLFTIVGMQLLGLGLCAHAYGAYFLGRRVTWFDRLRRGVRLEQALALGGGLLAAGVLMCFSVVAVWIGNDFGELGQETLLLGGATLIIAGLQIVFTSFLISILGLRRRGGRPAVLTLNRDLALLGPESQADRRGAAAAVPHGAGGAMDDL